MSVFSAPLRATSTAGGKPPWRWISKNKTRSGTEQQFLALALKAWRATNSEVPQEFASAIQAACAKLTRKHNKHPLPSRCH